MTFGKDVKALTVGKQQDMYNYLNISFHVNLWGHVGLFIAGVCIGVKYEQFKKR